MRLLLVTNDFPPKPGGIQQYLQGLVDAYPHPIRVLAPADPRARPDEQVVRSQQRFMWPTARVRRWIEDQARDFDPDVVVFGAPTPLPWLGRSLRQALDVPFAVLSHGAELTIPGAFPLTRQLVAGPLKAADYLLAVSKFTAAVVRRMTRRQVAVLGAGVDVEQFFPGERASGTIGCVSRFVPRKGHARVLRAAAVLRERGRDVDVLIVGRGRLEKRLRRLAERLEVPTRFEVDVPFKRLGELYRAIDVFCMPCRDRWLGLEREGFGLVYLEAAATGLPVLAGPSGGAPETVIPGETGFVVHTVDHIIEACEMLFTHPDRAREMGERGRQRVEAEFSWEAATERLISALEA